METTLRKFLQSTNYVLDLWSQNFNSKQNSVIVSNIFFIKPNDQPALTEEIKHPVKNDINVSYAGDKQLENPSHKLMRSERFMTKNLSTLLDKGWGYVKITLLYDKIGSYMAEKGIGCPFILIEGTEKQEQWFLWKAITGKEYSGPQNKSSISGLNAFKNDFAHHIGLSGLSFTVQKIGNYHDFIRTDTNKKLNWGITGGQSRASGVTFDIKIPDAKFGISVGRSAVVYRMIFWNPDQRDVFTGNHRFVIFSCNDNTGEQKSIIITTVWRFKSSTNCS